MRKWWLFALLMAFSAAPAAAQGTRVSLGYAFLNYLEDGGGNVPLGAFLSIGSAGKEMGFELDLGYHRDSADFSDISFVIHTFTAGVGPRFALGSGGAKPFVHVLGGLRHDRVEGESNTAFGGMAGLGVDVPAGSNVYLRLGADFQIFFDEGESVKTLRLGAGLTF